MKIAFLSFYSGSVNRGVETVVHELAGRLVKNHEVVVFQQGEINRQAIYKTQRINLNVNWNKRDMTGTFVRRLFLDYWSLKVGQFSLKTLKPIIDGKFDIVITFNGGWMAIIMRLATWLTGTKLVTSGQSGMGWDDRVNLLVFPNAFVPLSTKALEWAKRVNPVVRVAYIPNGVDLNRFKTNGKSHNTKLHRPIILTVGAFTKSKRIDLVIEAVSRLPGVNLLIVGDGKREVLEELANKLIPGRFEFLSVRHEKMPEIYRSADLFALLPHTSEAFGIVYVEAMASGVPVIAPADEVRREIIGSGGILVEHSDEPSDIAFAISEVLKKNWGDKPRTQAKKFDWGEIASKYEKLFKEIL